MRTGRLSGVDGLTWAEVGATSPRYAWQRVRALRHNPPGVAGTSAGRRATFDAALEQAEQAEQFMAAAATVGVATRPVLVFYGLRQAATAVACAAGGAAGDSWRLSGHGIRARHLTDAQRGGVATVTVQDEGRGAFTQLAALLDAAPLPDETPLPTLSALLPDTHRFPLDGAGDFHPLPVTAPTYFMAGARLTLQIDQLPGVLARPAGDDPRAADETSWQPERDRITEYLSRYPTLTAWEFLTPAGQPVGLQRAGPSSASLTVQVPLPEGRHPATEVAARTFPYANRQLAFPRVGGSDRPAHPFLAWYGLTYGLSMLARYEPTAWAARTSINRSKDAVPLEHLLDQALRALPELIYTTILRASDSPHPPASTSGP